MPNSTPARPGGVVPRTLPGTAASFRVIFHEPVCPDCGSHDITTTDIDTTDGLTETAHICAVCGAAWPVACIAEDLTPVPRSAA